MGARSKLVAVSAVIIGAGILVLSYALFVKAQAESLLNDITALTVGISTESEVKQLTTKHDRYMVSDFLRKWTFDLRSSEQMALHLEIGAACRVSDINHGGERQRLQH